MAKTICFCGVDGSGKTTQVELYKKYLDGLNINYKYVHVFSSGKTVVSNLHQNKFFSLLIKKIRALKNTKTGVFIKISTRVLNFLVDSWLTSIKELFNRKNQLVIYDRHFYDVLCVLAFDFLKFKKFIFFFSRFIPRPDIIIIFSSNAETVVKRKAEHSIADATGYCKLYDELARYLKVKSIKSDQSIEKIQEEIVLRFKAS